MGAPVTAATVFICLAFLLVLPVFLRPLFELLATGSPAGWTATAAVPTGGFVLYLRQGRSSATTEAGRNAALRAGAELLVAATAGAIINVVPGCGLIPASGMVMPVLYVLALVVTFNIGVLLLVHCVARPISAALSDHTIEILKLFAMMLMALNLLLSLTLISSPWKRNGCASLSPSFSLSAPSIPRAPVVFHQLRPPGKVELSLPGTHHLHRLPIDHQHSTLNTHDSKTQPAIDSAKNCNSSLNFPSVLQLTFPFDVAGNINVTGAGDTDGNYVLLLQEQI